MELFAHRGASAYAPQNTIPSFRKALEMGARGIELDVQLTSDAVPVVIHDFFLDKTTDMKGFIHSKSWKDIQRADAGSWFSPEFTGTKIPALEEVLELVPSDVVLNIEIKSLSFLKDNAAEIVTALLAQGGKRELLLSSFNHKILKKIQDISIDYPLGILTGSDMINFTSYIEGSGLKPYSLHPEASYLSAEYVEEAHKKGWKVLCYTINTPEQAALVESIGTDGVFSDYPDLLLNKNQ